MGNPGLGIGEDSKVSEFTKWFGQATATDGKVGFAPHPWQVDLAIANQAGNRLIRIPTGLGKTLGVLAAWIFHYHVRRDQDWPRRLVWCLPMRTLVEQTEQEAHSVINQLGLQDDVDVHVLMGGVEESRWYADPERPAILIGTQDMLLSRALNRGYAMGRAAWPRAFGLLNSDTLWVMDEVQLMGVGLTTSAQIQAFWETESRDGKSLPAPRATWWMSATLQPDWLQSPETQPFHTSLNDELLCVKKANRTGVPWTAKKSLQRIVEGPDAWTQHVIEAHVNHTADTETGRQTLVVVNTVRRARELHTQILKAQNKSNGKNDSLANTEIRLIHSRFRPADRANWTDQFLSRKTLAPDLDRILIATQVVEAGVDISASCLISELAPWPSLVQRFGRAARYGGKAKIIVLDSEPSDTKAALPYSVEELDAARDAIGRLSSASILDLEKFEEKLRKQDPTFLQQLYPYQPVHVLLQSEFEELFDTSSDLSGADMDISRFIREGESRDVQVFWREWEGDVPPTEIQPRREELCSVSLKDAKEWFVKLRKDRRAPWVWDYLDGQWQKVRDEALRPGLVFLVSPYAGGYDPLLGFTGDRPKNGESVSEVTGQQAVPTAELDGDRTEVSEQPSEAPWKTIGTHCREAGEVVQSLAHDVNLSEGVGSLLSFVMRLHDWGKSHPAFASGTYRVTPERADLAKAPQNSWRSLALFYETDTHGPRKGFRHELASCLGVLELLRGVNSDHPALLGGCREILDACGISIDDTTASWTSNSLADELNALDVNEFNLLLYLVACHHGKVRVSLHLSPKDQEFPFEDEQFVGEGMPIRGVREGDELPPVELPGNSGNAVQMPAIPLSLAPASMGLSARYGPSWSDRVLGLIEHFGPFTLGYYEALVRAADARASAMSDADPALNGVVLTIPNPNEIADTADFSKKEMVHG